MELYLNHPIAESGSCSNRKIKLYKSESYAYFVVSPAQLETLLFSAKKNKSLI